ncbi:MAG: DNA-processing protein DprA [Bdellovibrionota bacterium]
MLQKFSTLKLTRDSSLHLNNNELWKVQPPPEELFIKGSGRALELLAKLPSRTLAVVGTRWPQSRSIGITKQILSDLSGSDLVIISGLARGIDGAAHRAALDAGLPTIAVLGSGVDRIYPPEHALLADEILHNNGLIISEFTPSATAHPSNFIKRNRLIAGWSRALWVVEAGHRSGALNTAKWAREHHRDCFATPCFPGDQALAGNQILIDDGHASPLWMAHSLGSVWFEFSSLGRKKKRKYKSPATSDANLLATVVEKHSIEQGGVSAEYLLSWAISTGWGAQRFFMAFQEAASLGLVISNGTAIVSFSAVNQ